MIKDYQYDIFLKIKKNTSKFDIFRTRVFSEVEHDVIYMYYLYRNGRNFYCLILHRLFAMLHYQNPSHLLKKYTTLITSLLL